MCVSSAAARATTRGGKRCALRCPVRQPKSQYSIRTVSRRREIRSVSVLRSSIHAKKKIQWKLPTINHSDLGVGHGTVCSVTVVEREPNGERSSPQQPERRLHDEKGFPREGVLRLVRVQAS